MKRVNFKKLEVYTDVTRTNKTLVDGSKEFANLLYMGCNGIVAHALALRIYESKGEIEIDPQEEELIRITTNEKCTPAFIDSILTQLNNKESE